jgi:hypothetical protein
MDHRPTMQRHTLPLDDAKLDADASDLILWQHGFEQVAYVIFCGESTTSVERVRLGAHGLYHVGRACARSTGVTAPSPLPTG